MNSDNLTGEVLSNRYEILDKIGTGGMATVYKAKDKLLNRFVAVKVLRDSLEDEKDVADSFIKEAQSSASLVHNNIVSVYDVGEQDGINYMVMEYVDGITLKEYIKTRGSLPWQEACDFAIQICQGINEAHAINIVHRDIKPQNILMTRDKILKVTDFGIAKAMAAETTVAAGGNKNVLGSVHYISPEQARGGMTDARSDIYSLGIVLYEMLTGKVPFDGDTAVSVALMHLEKEPANVKAVNLDIPADLAYVTMKAISKEQSARYQNVTELVNDLHAVLADEPLPSREKMMSETEDEDAAQGDFNETYDDYAENEGGDKEKQEHSSVKVIKEKEFESRGRSSRKANTQQKTQKQKKENTIAVVLALATVVVIGLLAVGIWYWTNMSRETTVPDFVNMTLDEAEAAANNAHVVIAETKDWTYSDTIEKDRIISQSIDAGKVVKNGEEISIIVSLGASGGNIPTPNVVNQPYEEAVAAILEAGLNYDVIQESSPTIQLNYVIRQVPLAGTKLLADDSVTLYISTGAGDGTEVSPIGRQVSVPSLIGLSREQAENTLSANGLSLGSVSKSYSSAPEGQVISQSPELGTKINEGDVVNLVISRGTETPPEVETPAEEPAQSDNSGYEEAVEDSGSSYDSSESYSESTQSSSDYSEYESSESSGDSGGGSTTRSFSVVIPENANDTVNVEIVVNGRTVHNETHSKSEGTVFVNLEGSGTAQVQAYIDGSKIIDKPINFN